MRRFRYLLWLGLAGILVASYFMLRGSGLWATTNQVRPQEVPAGDQEIAFIQPATSCTVWERFVAGIEHVQKQSPSLILDASRAFPDQSTAVPEVTLGFPGTDSKLRIRWYKMTSEVGIGDWVRELSRREPAPLAVIGGGSSDRAYELALALKQQEAWRGARPLLLITSATADNVFSDETALVPASLMDVYPGRTYRFCFTNSQMAAALWDFVWSQDDLRPITSLYLHPLLAATAAQAGTDVLGGLPLLLWGLSQPQPCPVQIVEWLDDPYSRDLASQFRTLFSHPDTPPLPHTSFTIPYSVGGFLTPNPREALVVQQLINFIPPYPDARFLLIVPSVNRPARRFLRALAMAAPPEADNIVVVTGDSLAFNTIYRDRHFAWHIQEVPVPVVAFYHHNPVAWEEGDPASTGTEDALLNADIVQVLLDAAFTGEITPGAAPTTTNLVDTADALNDRIQKQRSHYFLPEGNRLGGSGEYVACLKPFIVAGRVLPRASLEIWSRRSVGPGHTIWERIRKLDLDYSESPREVPRGAF